MDVISRSFDFQKDRQLLCSFALQIPYNEAKHDKLGRSTVRDAVRAYLTLPIYTVEPITFYTTT